MGDANALMEEQTTLAALDPVYPAQGEFTVVRRDLMTLWFLAMASAPGGAWILDFLWLAEGEQFPAHAAVRLGSQMRESPRSGELAQSLSTHVNPFADPRTESVRMTGLFQEFADFVRHSGGFEALG